MIMKFEKFYDAIIIGAGAAGITASWNLGRGKIKILCIDQGPFLNKKILEQNLIWSRFNEEYFNFNSNERNLAQDYPIDDTESDIKIANFNAIGGSTILYSGHFPRFHPSDFKTRYFDKVGINWPINYNDLKKFYEINEKYTGISGLNNDPAYPPDKKKLLPPLPIGKAGELIAKSLNELNWHWWPSYSAVLTKNYMGRKKFNKSGNYNMLYPYNSKSSIDNTYLKLIDKKKVTILSDHRVLKITQSKHNEVDGIIISNKKNELFKINGSIILLAASGAGTPRILLNSKNKFFKYGMSNNSGMLGKNLMLHPLGFVEGLFENFLASHLGPQGCNIFSHEFYETNKKNNFKRGYTIQVLRSQNPLYFSKYLKKINKIKYGNRIHDYFFNNFGKRIPIAVICEDLPDLKNAIVLDNKNKDNSGMPGIKVFYKIKENTKKMIKHGIKKSKTILEKAGAKEIISFGPVRNTGWHIMGTARMGLDKNNSVVNKNGRSHDIKNLYIVDSSIFPTSAGVNPVPTIQAMALKITNNILKK